MFLSKDSNQYAIGCVSEGKVRYVVSRSNTCSDKGDLTVLFFDFFGIQREICTRVVVSFTGEAATIKLFEGLCWRDPRTSGGRWTRRGELWATRGPIAALNEKKNIFSQRMNVKIMSSQVSFIDLVTGRLRLGPMSIGDFACFTFSKYGQLQTFDKTLSTSCACP